MTFLLICFLLLVDWMHAVTRTNHPNCSATVLRRSQNPDSFGEAGEVEPSAKLVVFR
jgi:hypothetical protein